MDQRNNNYRPKRTPPHSNPGKRTVRTNYPDDVDRYNYVDRDIYSNGGSHYADDSRYAGGGRRGKKRNNRKRGGAKKVFFTILSLVLIIALGIGAYAMIMMSRLDRSDNTNTASYVEQPSAAPAWGVISDSKITNILLIGADKGDDGNSSRSDTTMLLSIDNTTKTIKLVSFLRDLYVEIPTMKKQKLNAAYSKGGAGLTMQTLENNFRVNIDKYVSVDFDSFSAIIDKMGGLDIQMDQKLCDAENQNMGSNLKPGVNHLNGRLALYYARIRETDSDFGRTGRQREVMELMIQKFKTMNPLEINKLMYDNLHYVKTNLSDADLVYLASIAGSASKYPMKTMHVPNLNTYEDRKIKGIGDVLDPDLTKNSKLLRAFLYGENAEDTTTASAGN
ncbi:MAG: LytR family transcriptional regulator [Caproiciproducens sp.]|nr:LytR family transcriptional regulator [Caproiciproducens sp.]